MDVLMKLTKRIIGKNEDTVGLQIRARRKELNMTQGQVAEFVGCTAQQIQKYESGISKMTIPILFRVCQALRAHPTRFLSDFTFAEMQESDRNSNMEARLLNAFRTVENDKVKERIVNLVEALISTSTM